MFQNVVVILDVCSSLIFGSFVVRYDCFIGVIRFVTGVVVIIFGVGYLCLVVFGGSGISFLGFSFLLVFIMLSFYLSLNCDCRKLVVHLFSLIFQTLSCIYLVLFLS